MTTFFGGYPVVRKETTPRGVIRPSYHGVGAQIDINPKDFARFLGIAGDSVTGKMLLAGIERRERGDFAYPLLRPATKAPTPLASDEKVSDKESAMTESIQDLFELAAEIDKLVSLYGPVICEEETSFVGFSKSGIKMDRGLIFPREQLIPVGLHWTGDRVRFLFGPASEGCCGFAAADYDKLSASIYGVASAFPPLHMAICRHLEAAGKGKGTDASAFFSDLYERLIGKPALQEAFMRTLNISRNVVTAVARSDAAQAKQDYYNAKPEYGIF